MLAGAIVLIVLCAFSAAPAQAAGVTWSKGDSWTYSWEGLEAGINATGSLQMEVSGTTSDSYDVALSGTVALNGVFNGTPTTGSGSLTGSMVRLKSDFGLTSMALISKLNVTLFVLTVPIEVGLVTSSSPALVDLPIDQALVPGMHLYSNSTITGDYWINATLLGNDTTPIDEQARIELIVEANETIVTPAGTFECNKLVSANASSEVTYYYSEKVGNYVKVTGNGSQQIGFGALGNLTLTKYSYGTGSGIASYFTGPNWWVLPLIVVVIIIVVVSVLAARRRGRSKRASAPPQQEAPAPAPPPPPQG